MQFRPLASLALACTRLTTTGSVAVLLCGAVATSCGREDTLVPDSPEMLDLLQEARLAWSESGLTPPPVSDHGTPNVHRVDDIDAVCGATLGAATLGCVHFDPLAVYISSATPEELLARTVLHEMGHTIRGDGEHLGVVDGCPAHSRGPAVMCPAPAVDAPTTPDVTFIGGSPR
jgi:hypothetical protein